MRARLCRVRERRRTKRSQHIHVSLTAQPRPVCALASAAVQLARLVSAPRLHCDLYFPVRKIFLSQKKVLLYLTIATLKRFFLKLHTALDDRMCFLRPIL